MGIGMILAVSDPVSAAGLDLLLAGTIAVGVLGVVWLLLQSLRDSPLAALQTAQLARREGRAQAHELWLQSCTRFEVCLGDWSAVPLGEGSLQTLLADLVRQLRGDCRLECRGAQAWVTYILPDLHPEVRTAEKVAADLRCLTAACGRFAAALGLKPGEVTLQVVVPARVALRAAAALELP